MNVRQLRDNIIVPTITALGMYSPSAVNLLLGTAAQESQMGYYLVQNKGGPAIGLYQCEPITYNDVWDRAITNNVSMRAKIKLLLGYEGKPPAQRMVSDLALATVIARLKYYLIPKQLPDANDIAGLAKFYKVFFNSEFGAATEEEFIKNYDKYITKGII